MMMSGKSFFPTKASQKNRADPPTSANWLLGANVASGTSGEESVFVEKMTSLATVVNGKDYKIDK